MTEKTPTFSRLAQEGKRRPCLFYTPWYSVFDVKLSHSFEHWLVAPNVCVVLNHLVRVISQRFTQHFTRKYLTPFTHWVFWWSAFKSKKKATQRDCFKQTSIWRYRGKRLVFFCWKYKNQQMNAILNSRIIIKKIKRDPIFLIPGIQEKHVWVCVCVFFKTMFLSVHECTLYNSFTSVGTVCQQMIIFNSLWVLHTSISW